MSHNTWTVCFLLVFIFYTGVVDAKNFLLPGKWIEDHLPYGSGGYICVAQNNNPPSAAALAAEDDAINSTGNGRWIGKCKVLSYHHSAKTKKVSATILCQQTRERNNRTFRWKSYFSGVAINKSSYIVSRGRKNPDRSYYKFISPICRNPKGQGIKIPKSKAWDDPQDPAPGVLYGFPSNSILILPNS